MPSRSDRRRAAARRRATAAQTTIVAAKPLDKPSTQQPLIESVPDFGPVREQPRAEAPYWSPEGAPMIVRPHVTDTEAPATETPATTDDQIVDEGDASMSESPATPATPAKASEPSKDESRSIQPSGFTAGLQRMRTWFTEPQTHNRAKKMALVAASMLFGALVFAALTGDNNSTAFAQVVSPAATPAEPPTVQYFAYVEYINDTVPGHPDEVMLSTSCGDFTANVVLVQSSDVYESHSAILEVTSDHKVKSLSSGNGFGGNTYNCNNFSHGPKG